MEKISITIDVMRIPREKIVERRYHDKANREFICKDLKLDIVPLNEPKMLKEGENWQLWRTHFVAIQATKEDREAKRKSVIVGSAIMFKEKKVEDGGAPADEVDPADIPF